MHPQGGETVSVSREQHFMNSYIAKTANNNFAIGAFGIGSFSSALELVKGQFKRSPVIGIIAGSEEAIRNSSALFERMKYHDEGVEHRRKKN